MILANTLTAEMGLIPGLAMLGPAMGLPLSVLAAFVERPFWTRAGVMQHTIWYSLQANLVSLVIGYGLMIAAAVIGDVLRDYDALFVVWPFLAVMISIAIERTYLNRRVPGRTVQWGWATLGNLISAALCVGLLFFITYAKADDDFRGLRLALRPHAPWLHAFAAIGSAVLFFYAFTRTRRAGAAASNDSAVNSDPSHENG